MEYTYKFDAELVAKECVEWIKEWFEHNGPNCNAVIGISGGKDSSVVAALCVEALGKDRVFGVMMPNGTQSDIADSFKVCEHLNIHNTIVNIEETVSAIQNSILDGLICLSGINYTEGKLSEQANINLPPRIRMATLYAISQSINGRVACTDNLSERFIGYSTHWGDNVGDFSPLSNLTSAEVVAVGDVLGLPFELTHKTPSDGLCGKTDEDNFGFTYNQLNNVIIFNTCGDEEVDNKILELCRKNHFKRIDLPSYQPSPEVYK